MNQSFLSHSTKRVFDVSIALVALMVLSPLLFMIWGIVSLRLERPALFRQKRSGRFGKPFEIIKFKTMISAVDKEGEALSDDERLTSLGKFLRKASLDELPELWNVLVGEMSLVGPRPFIYQYQSLYTDSQNRRHDVRPGITGWAQVNGRNAISWEEKFELDVWYVENRSFLLDVKIIWLTVWRLFKSDGISSDGHATMPVFTGTAPPTKESA